MRVVDQGLTHIGTALDQLREIARQLWLAEANTGPFKQRLHSHRAQGGFFRRLPDHGIAAHQCQRSVPGPDGNGEIEGGDDPHHAKRLPGFHHAVTRALGRDGEAIKLPRHTHCKVANVDHLLHFAQAFRADLANLE